jgi:L-arabinokinase
MHDRNESLRVIIRTNAPRWLFQALPSSFVDIHSLRTDPGVAEEQNVLRIDEEETVRRVLDFMNCYDDLVDSEVQFVLSENVKLIVADVPFLAGDVSETSAIPCVAVSNFLWDWIYGSYANATAAYRQAIERIHNAYCKFDLFLRLPFHHEAPSIANIMDTPLVCGRSLRTKEDIASTLQVDFEVWRRIAFVTYRGRLSEGSVARVANENSDTLFLFSSLCVGDATENSNVRLVASGGHLGFQDLVAASDLVIGKLGYGTLAACVASKARLLYPRRVGFREDELLIAGAGRYCCAAEVPQLDFDTGDWSCHLDTLCSKPNTSETLALEGAEVCAEALFGFL